MMVRSMSSNSRPDTLVQDRTPQPHRFLLQRTAGSYIRVSQRPLWSIADFCNKIGQKRTWPARVECTFRQNSHLTKVVGVARGDQDCRVTETPRSSEKCPLTEHRRLSCHSISQHSFGSLLQSRCCSLYSRHDGMRCDGHRRSVQSKNCTDRVLSR